MAKGNVMNVAKGVLGGMLAGVAIGAAGKMMIDKTPKMKKKADRAVKTLGQIADTAQYLFS